MPLDTVGYIYRLTSPSGRSYIGLSKDVRKRWSEHQLSARNNESNTLHKAIRKYGWNSFNKEVIATGLYVNIKFLEISAIYIFDTFNKGYNMTTGGDGTSGNKKTPEQIERLREVNLGRFVSEETRARQSEAQKGLTRSAEHKANIGLASKKFHQTHHIGAQISKAKKGVPQTEEARRIHAESQRAKWADPVYKARQLALQGIGLQKRRLNLLSARLEMFNPYAA